MAAISADGVEPACTDRSYERARIAKTAASGDHQGILVRGSAGDGRTWLARATARDFRAAGQQVQLLRATKAGASVPFGALAPLLADRSLPTGTPVATMAALHSVVAERRGDEGLVVVVDDAQWLDEASAATVHQLTGTEGLFVVLTVRAEEPTPDAVLALWKDGIADRLELRPLSVAALRRLLHERLGAPVTRRCGDELLRLSGHNCQLLVALTESALADGTLQLRDGYWRLCRPVRMSARLSDLLEERLRDLRSTTRAVLESVAWAEPIDLDSLERLTDKDALADACRTGLVLTETTGHRTTVRLRLPLHGEVLRHGVPPVLQHRLVREQAGVPLSVGVRRRHEDLLRAVVLRLDAGAAVPTAPVLEAFRIALALPDLTTAQRIAVTFAARQPRVQDVRPAIMLAEVLQRRCRPEEALQALAHASPPARHAQLRDSVTAARARVLLLSGHPDDAARLLDRSGLRSSRDETPGPLQVAGAAVELARGRPLASLALLDGAGEVAEGAGPPALAVRALALAFAGRFDRADELAETGQGGRVAMPVPVTIPWQSATHMLASIGRCRPALIEQVAHRADAEARATRHASLRSASAAVLGWGLLLRGDVAAASDQLADCLADLQETDLDGMLTFALAGRAAAGALAGDVALVDSILDRWAAHDPPPVRWADPLLSVGRSLAAYQRGLVTAARTTLARALDDADDRGLRAVEIILSGTALMIGAPDLTIRPLKRLSSVTSSLAGDLLGCAEAMLGHDAVRLRSAGDALERHELFLPAAMTAATAARYFRAGGRTAEAASAAQAARRRAMHCPGADLTFLDPPSTSLTPRELEIARLAAAGLTSPQIASMLSVSVRTVDNHLSRCYQKLGLDGRTYLAEALEADSGAIDGGASGAGRGQPPPRIVSL